MTGTAVYIGARAQLVSFLRQPLNIALLVLVPLFVILGFGEAMASIPDMPTMEALPETVGTVWGAMFSTAFLAGILGLFQSIDAQAADRRLILTGYTPATLLGARLCSLSALTVVIATITYVVLSLSVEPAAPFVTFGTLLIGGATYAFLGILIGAVIPRTFEGSLVLVFIANMDAFLGSGLSTMESQLPKFLPLYHPNRLLQTAVIDGSIAQGDLLASLSYAIVLLVGTFLVFAQISTTEVVV